MSMEHDFVVTYLPTGQVKSFRCARRFPDLFRHLGGLKFAPIDGDLLCGFLLFSTRKQFAETLAAGAQRVSNRVWTVKCKADATYTLDELLF